MPIATEPPRLPQADALLADVFARRRANVAPRPTTPQPVAEAAPQMPISDVSQEVQQFADQVERMEIRGPDRHAAFREFAGLYELGLLSLGDRRRLIELGADADSLGLGQSEDPQVDADGARRAVGAFFNNGILHLDLAQLIRESREDRNRVLDAEVARAAEQRQQLYQLSLDVLALANPQTREALGPNITADNLMPPLYVLNALLRTEPPQATDPEFFRVLEGLNNAYLQSIILDPSGNESLAFTREHVVEEILDRATHVNMSPVEIPPQLRDLANFVAEEALFCIGQTGQGPAAGRDRQPAPPPPTPTPANFPPDGRIDRFLKKHVEPRLQRWTKTGERRPPQRQQSPETIFFAATHRLDGLFNAEALGSEEAIRAAFGSAPGEQVIRDLRQAIELRIDPGKLDLEPEEVVRMRQKYAHILSLVAPRPDVQGVGVAPRPPPSTA